MDKIETFRQFISPFITGENADALIATLADQAQNLEDLSIAVTDQLTISTASGEYLEKRLSEVGVIQPYDLGMSDDSLRSMGIQITAAKQIPEVLHTILDTFYGAESVRAHTESGQAEPFVLADEMDLILSFEDGVPLTIVFQDADFEHIGQATAQEVADVITRGIRANGRYAFAAVLIDYTTNLKYVRIFGSARGPYSLVEVLGGQVQNILEFPTIRATNLAVNNTIWQITRNIGDTIRFRWSGSGSKPALNKVSVGDKVMIYGSGFTVLGTGANDLTGTFTVTNVRLASTGVAYDDGYFEVQNANSGLRNSTADIAPPSNASPIYYYYTVTQAGFDDLKFFLAKKNTSYSQTRYALAFEPAANQLKIYLPATTNVVYRNLIGGAHMHLKYASTTFDGAYGSTSVASAKIEIAGDYTIRYPQSELDADGSGGTLGWSTYSIPIDYVFRENGYTTVVTTIPHGITSTSTIVNVQVLDVSVDDPDYSFLGPYMWDLTSPYTLTGEIVTSRESIFAGESRSFLLVDGSLITTSGILVMDLGGDNEEGPVRFLGVQTQGQSVASAISTYSQNGYNVTVHTTTPHGAIIGSQVTITGTTWVNGSYTVDTVPNATTYTVTSLVSQIKTGTGGLSTILSANAISTLVLDSSYIFTNSHGIGTSATVLSSASPYVPLYDGSDYSAYITGTANATDFAEQLIQDITALGINLEIIILYPGDTGLGNQGGSSDPAVPPTSDKVDIWGTI